MIEAEICGCPIGGWRTIGATLPSERASLGRLFLEIVAGGQSTCLLRAYASPDPWPGKSKLSEREPTTTVEARCAWKNAREKQGFGEGKKNSRTG